MIVEHCWELALALAPLLGLVANVTCHVGLCRLFPRASHLGLIVTGFLVGFVATTSASLLALGQLAYLAADALGLATLNLLAYTGLGYGYFTWVNLALTSLRVQMLKLLLHAPAGGQDSASLLALYDADKIIDVRLERLERWGQIEARHGRYVVPGVPLFLRLHSVIGMLRHVVLGGGATW